MVGNSKNSIDDNQRALIDSIPRDSGGPRNAHEGSV